MHGANTRFKVTRDFFIGIIKPKLVLQFLMSLEIRKIQHYSCQNNLRVMSRNIILKNPKEPLFFVSVFFSVSKCIFKSFKKYIFANILLKIQNLVLKFLEGFLITPKNKRLRSSLGKNIRKKLLYASFPLKKLSNLFYLFNELVSFSNS